MVAVLRYGGHPPKSRINTLGNRYPHLHIHVLGSRLVHGQIRQIDVGLEGRGKFNFSLLCGLADTLQGHVVLCQVDSLVFLELGHQVVQKRVVEVLASQESVAVCRLDFKHSLLDFEDRDIESASAKIKDGDAAIQNDIGLKLLSPDSVICQVSRMHQSRSLLRLALAQNR